MKKNLFKLFLLPAAMLMLASCGGFMGVDVTDQKSVDDNLRKNLEKFVSPDASVLEIEILPTSNFTKTLGTADVRHFAPEDDELLAYKIMLGGIDKDEPTKSYASTSHLNKRKPESGMKLKDIDFGKIAANVNAAAEEMETAGYDFDGVGMYAIHLSSDPAKVKHKFRLESKAGTKMGRDVHGRSQMQQEYYYFDFTADAEGNVTMDK